MDEAELLFSDILNCNRLSLYQNRSVNLDKDKSSFVASVLKRRIKGEPLQYILGKSEFMGLEFKVNKDVFIPRPETEILVEAVIELAHSAQRTAHNILDIGTGSGCIAISLAKFLKDIQITASDISNAALEIARENGRLNNVEINFLQGDLFSNCGLQIADYDIIVSNPPYIPTKQIDTLQPEIKFEPFIALDAGKDGLSFYRRLINESGYFLKENGFLVMEMGFNQRQGIEEIFRGCKNLKILKIIKDYNRIDRIVVSRKVSGSG